MSGGWGQRWGLTKALLKCDLIKCVGKRPPGREEAPAASPALPGLRRAGVRARALLRPGGWLGAPGATPGSCHTGTWWGACLGGATARGGPLNPDGWLRHPDASGFPLPASPPPRQLRAQSGRGVSYPWAPSGWGHPEPGAILLIKALSLRLPFESVFLNKKLDPKFSQSQCPLVCPGNRTILPCRLPKEGSYRSLPSGAGGAAVYPQAASAPEGLLANRSQLLST